MHGRLTPQSIRHGCLEYHYTKLGNLPPMQSSIDALNASIPNLADLLTDLLADLPPSFEHRCLEYCYTTLGRSTGRCNPPVH